MYIIYKYIFTYIIFDARWLCSSDGIDLYILSYIGQIKGTGKEYGRKGSRRYRKFIIRDFLLEFQVGLPFSMDALHTISFL
jgi:hypothetical protein